MSSQANPPRSGNTPPVTLTAHGLVVDAATTLAAVYARFAIAGAFALADLFASDPGANCYIEPPAPADPSPEAREAVIPPPGAVRIASLAASGIAAAATAAGCDSAVHRVWADRIGATFASEPRLIEALRIGTGWRYLRINPTRTGTGGLITRGEVVSGNYLVLSAGLGDPLVRFVARIEQIPTRDLLATTPGFAAETITATCPRCRRQWTASGGRPVFTPSSHDGIEWGLDSAGDLGLVTNTVACPVEVCPGRVGFTAAGGQA
ncbi:hypothetical protein [Glycomyces arizonensis]|uniref:hypothetical protein n=1 Tax=Glycomyces arizonensis TaxID=256035 RepID=UPI0003F66A15|nr:hypothetical protein [Glycomyces arizonensis]